MYNAMRVAVERVMMQIPPQILQLAFLRNLPYQGLSLQQRVIDEVINKRVRTDCNLVGGKTIQVTLQSNYHEPTVADLSQINSGTGIFSIYRIPPEARQFCDIVAVHHLQYPMPHGNGYGPPRGSTMNPLCAASQELFNSHTGGGTSPTPTAEPLQGDLVRIHPGAYVHIDWVLSCRVAYDENMTNLNPSAIDTFAKLAVLATKMYIYNNLIVELDQGFIQGGAEIQSIRNIVETYSNLEEEYYQLIPEHFQANVVDIQRFGTFMKHML